MAGLLNTILIIVAAFFLLVSVFFVLRGLQARGNLADSAYGVARQDARHVMLVSFTRGAVLLLIAVIFFAIYGLLPQEEDTKSAGASTPEKSVTPTIGIIETRAPAASQEPTRSIEVATPAATEMPSEPDTSVPEPTQAPTTALQSTTAVVGSFNGLWLRSEPDPESDQLELIPNETILIVLRETEPSDQTDWQYVRSPNGNEGWVFKQFIVYQQDE